MTLNKKAFALASGIVWAVLVFLATVYVMFKGGGHTLVLLQQFYWGYNISWGGAFLGLLYSFVYAFIVCWIFALLYNAFAGGRKPKEME